MKHKLFAIFGNPVSHSISPLMHNYALQGLKIDGCYTRYRLEEGEKLREKFLSLQLSGVNVTVPHKEAAFTACDEIRGIAREIEAVNTVVLEEDRLIGYNTDAPGFLKSARLFGEIRSVTILGAGGTAKALAAIFHEEGTEVTIINRSEKRLHYFQERGYDCMTWESYRSHTSDLIVNTTSAGLQESTLPAPEALLNDLFSKAKYAIDVIYNKETPFMKLAKSSGLPVKDGSEMLLFQGVIAFNHFFGERLHEEEITAFMKQAFD
ncbi:MAG: shikimate dehydrogenase [Sulfurospirillum sp.]|nr:MAG: shikimate dehydrogenase [Sulfurospirillum sp.]